MIVWQMMSVEIARTAVGRTTIECCMRWCATRCAGSDTAEMTSEKSWTSAGYCSSPLFHAKWVIVKAIQMLTGMSVMSQCLHHFLDGLSRLGASGSTISNVYVLSCRNYKCNTKTLGSTAVFLTRTKVINQINELNCFIVCPKVDQRAGQLSLPNVGITKTERNSTRT